MILTVTLNPSIDRRYVVENFESGKVFRARDVQYTPGGKGLNVSRVIKDLGKDVIATGFLGGKSGEFISEKLDELDIENRFVQVSNETRSCLAIISNNGSQTEVLEPGPEIFQSELDDFYNEYREIIDECDIICASGSLPRNVPIDMYSKLIKIAKDKGKKFILDTSGEALVEGMKASPYMIKPNKEELEKILGTTISTERELVDGLKSLGRYNIDIIVASLGSEGSIVYYDDKIYRVSAPKIKAVNPVGSGDSMIAGFAVALEMGYDLETMVKFASACGTANAMEVETGKVNIENVHKIISHGDGSFGWFLNK